MSDVAIKVENISKLYQIGDTSSGSLRESIAGLFSSRGNKRTEDFWALKDISFEVKKGEAVGIVGKNGAGKSTLLKVLSRITEPTRGRIEINGRVSSLLEVGTGFHPELTGRENVYLNGTILGMSRAEVKTKFDEIVDFSGVEKFLDTPVKRYSSGMKVRLAFAVAAHLEPEILIIDEVLAVGDAEFQKKCLGKMEDVAGEGRTIIFVSHDMGAVKRLTSHAVYLRDGLVADYDRTPRVIETYLRYGQNQMERNTLDHYRRNKHTDTVKIVDVDVSANNGQVEMGTPFTINIELEVFKAISGANLTLILKRTDGTNAAVLFSWDHGFSLSLSPGNHRVSIDLDNHQLAVGGFVADIGINQSISSSAFDVLYDLPLVDIKPSQRFMEWENRRWGVAHFENLKWTVDHATLQSK